MYKGVADPLHGSFTLLHCWHVLRHKQKWIDVCAKKNQKVPVHTAGTNESRHDEEQGECHTSPSKDVRPPGKKKAKEQLYYRRMQHEILARRFSGGSC
jgi:hypothetical protein